MKIMMTPAEYSEKGIAYSHFQTDESFCRPSWGFITTHITHYSSFHFLFHYPYITLYNCSMGVTGAWAQGDVEIFAGVVVDCSCFVAYEIFRLDCIVALGLGQHRNSLESRSMLGFRAMSDKKVCLCCQLLLNTAT